MASKSIISYPPEIKWRMTLFFQCKKCHKLIEHPCLNPLILESMQQGFDCNLTRMMRNGKSVIKCPHCVWENVHQC